METHGIQVDVPRAQNLLADLDARDAILNDQMVTMGLATRDRHSKVTKRIGEIQARVSTCFGGSPPLTEKNHVSTTADTLRATGDASLAAVAEHVEAAGRRDVVQKLLQQAPIVRPKYEVLVGTGRTSTSKPNIQGVPRTGGVRECLSARPGHVILACDYSTAELRSLAQVQLDLLGTSALADMLRTGRDVHIVMAAAIAGDSYEELHAAYKAGDKRAKDLRQLAKAANFGFPGGLGARTFIEYAAKAPYNRVLTLADAELLKSAWLSTFPEMQLYFDRASVIADSGAPVVIPRSGRVRGNVVFCQACNTPFQGLVADGAKHTLFLIAHDCYAAPESPLYGARLLISVHDEVVLEVRESTVAQCADRVEELMIAGMRVFLPDVPVEVETTASRRWSKSAKTLRDSVGNLLIWEDDNTCQQETALQTGRQADAADGSESEGGRQ